MSELRLKALMPLRIAYCLITPPLLLPFLLGVGHQIRRRRLLLPMTVIVSFVGSAVPPWFLPHYWAPVLPVLFLVSVAGLRSLSLCRAKRRYFGRAACGYVLGFYLIVFVVACLVRQVPGPSDWPRTRGDVVARLKGDPGEHLVLVRYSRGHPADQEWVYNEADIDAAKIVWAHEMDSVKNHHLRAHFKGRRSWLLEPDANPPRLRPME